jgi:hypothetical protein
MQPRFGETPPEPRDPKRFMLSISAAQAMNPAAVLIHDTRLMNDQCEQVPEKDQSRFGDFEWALQKGFTPCPMCLGNGAKLPRVEGPVGP